MKCISIEKTALISGGLNLDGMRESTNVIDLRGTDMGDYIDANNICWPPGTSSEVMYPDSSLYNGYFYQSYDEYNAWMRQMGGDAAFGQDSFW